jgi:hypothetical protein
VVRPKALKFNPATPQPKHNTASNNQAKCPHAPVKESHCNARAPNNGKCRWRKRDVTRRANAGDK